MELNGIWSELYKIPAFMVDEKREMTLVGIANLCQEVAGNHANSRNLGFHTMQKRGLAWVLNRLKIEVSRYPIWQETIRIKTWVSQMQPFSHRHFGFFDSQDQALAYAYSIWIPLDTETHRPRRLTDFDVVLSDMPNPCKMPEKLSEHKRYSDISERIEADSISEKPTDVRVSYTDLDMLGHVNNVKYIEWILNEAYRQTPDRKYRKATINYIQEVFIHETVEIIADCQMHSTEFSLKRPATGELVCLARLA
jgi:acyl-ACP thioesterase